MVPAGLGCRIIMAMVEKGSLGHIFFDELNRCKSDSLFLDVWTPGVFGLEDFIPWLVMFMLGPCGSFSGGPCIWADGFIRSSQRRIQLPTFLPTSMSLCCMFLWNLRAISKAARTQLWKKSMKNEGQSSKTMAVPSWSNKFVIMQNNCRNNSICQLVIDITAVVKQ